MKIGLALSGGAARGLAHVGVLNYLEEKGLEPDIIAGTSAGSIAGALYCSGYSAEEVGRIAAGLSWKDLIRVTIPRIGLIDSRRLLKVLQEYLGAKTFEDLERPLLVNAVDLLSGREIILKQGPVAQAVQASCAIPGIFTPVKWQGCLLVDGGLLDNLPTKLLRNRGLDQIIAVNVGGQKPLDHNPGTIIEVLIQSFDILRRTRDEEAVESSDIIIEPDLGDIAFHDTGQAEELFARGYEAAREALAGFEKKKKGWSISRWFKKGRHSG